MCATDCLLESTQQLNQHYTHILHIVRNFSYEFSPFTCESSSSWYDLTFDSVLYLCMTKVTLGFLIAQSKSTFLTSCIHTALWDGNILTREKFSKLTHPHIWRSSHCTPCFALHIVPFCYKEVAGLCGSLYFLNQIMKSFQQLHVAIFDPKQVTSSSAWHLPLCFSRGVTPKANGKMQFCS